MFDYVIPKWSATNDPNLADVVLTKGAAKMDMFVSSHRSSVIYAYGDAGVGKSVAAMALARKYGRPAIRIQMSFSTTVEELIGRTELVRDGDTTITKYVPSPIITGFTTEGCVIVIDEVDSANPRVLMELQSILELKGYLVKKTGEYILPASNILIVATGNTSGLGDTTGEFIGVSPLNKAFRSRFRAFLRFDHPTPDEMRQIEANVFRSNPLLPRGYEGDTARWDGLFAHYVGVVHTAYRCNYDAHGRNEIGVILNPRNIINIIENIATTRMSPDDSRAELATKFELAYSMVMDFFDEDMSASLSRFFTLAATPWSGSAAAQPAAASNTWQMPATSGFTTTDPVVSTPSQPGNAPQFAARVDESGLPIPF